jgi:hypothetical protein
MRGKLFALLFHISEYDFHMNIRGSLFNGPTLRIARSMSTLNFESIIY